MATLVLDFRDFQARSDLQRGSRMRASTETIEACDLHQSNDLSV